MPSMPANAFFNASMGEGCCCVMSSIGPRSSWKSAPEAEAEAEVDSQSFSRVIDARDRAVQHGKGAERSAAGSAMPNDSFDQDAWLARIAYRGPREATLEALRGLVFAHAHAIAYESLDIMLGRVPSLGIADLQRKMIDQRRGGYCFEQNMLFRAGLRSLGYKVTSLQGRVVRGLAIDAPRPAIHMLLQVELPEGHHLADVGFGNLAPTAPLLLAPHVEQATLHGLMRFIEVNGELTLQQLLGDRWEHIYRVIPYPRYDAEYDVANWYTATHPDAPYLSNMIAACPLSDGSRLTMFNGRVTKRAPNGESHRRLLETTEAFAAVLRDEFALAVSDGDLHEMLQVMEERGARGAPHPFFA